jgi:predicted nucleotidyltransferase
MSKTRLRQDVEDAPPAGYVEGIRIHRDLTNVPYAPFVSLVPSCYSVGMTAPDPDPVLKKFRAAIAEAYGARLERVVLFGSRARGDARPDSDYDVAVFLYDVVDRFCEVDRLAEIQTDIMDETDAFVHAMPFPAGAWAERPPTTFS